MTAQPALDELRALLDELASAGGLWDLEAYAARGEALDRLEIVTLGLEEALAAASISGAAAMLLQQAAATSQRLAEANRALCTALRTAIGSGTCRGDEARRTLERLAMRPGGALMGPEEEEYDLLDSLVSELLLDAEAPGTTLPQVAERIAYQPTPAHVVLELLDRIPLGPGDVFYDLGAGLGHVCLLVHWLSGARAIGIEVEPAYCGYARQQARALRLTGVEFVEGDVREASLAGGTCYFLYTPFTGRTLAEALDRLAGEARLRAITVAAYGPCVAEVGGQPWLVPLDGPSAAGLAIFRNRFLAAS